MKERLAFKALTTLSLVLAISACNNGEVSYKSGGMQQTSQSGNGSVPNDLKALVYPGATASGAQTALEDSKDATDYSKYLQLTSSDSIEEVSQWYENKLKKDREERTEGENNLYRRSYERSGNQYHRSR